MKENNTKSIILIIEKCLLYARNKIKNIRNCHGYFSNQLKNISILSQFIFFSTFFQKSSPRKRSVNAPFEDGSDESETSSICSEKSTDYVRRTSDVSLFSFIKSNKFKTFL